MNKNAFIALLFLLPACSQPTENPARVIALAVQSPQLDGVGNEQAWEAAPWWPINQRWLGGEITPSDFSGRFKMLWASDTVFLLAEIIDDTLIDTHIDPLVKYWDDDCLELFVDEDASGGDHQYNHSAFAYHIDLDLNVMDIGPDSLAHRYDHVKAAKTQHGKTTTWECAIVLYANNYTDGGTNTPVALKSGKTIGFGAAYCDNDVSVERENFMGSMPVEGADKNRGWIDAGIFGRYLLE